ncbi:hypothetical protein EJB05_30775 [Eragrostis curvula]|uniref:Uncharacterized protein n=1 Tax=Eragrostis curvula TaxID=38414 RepID=A0A5J9UD27_9POAL|nr:hypothetical protein EJB05_30775 [Eragrostis curvula]
MASKTVAFLLLCISVVASLLLASPEVTAVRAPDTFQALASIGTGHGGGGVVIGSGGLTPVHCCDKTEASEAHTDVTTMGGGSVHFGGITHGSVKPAPPGTHP